MNFLFLLFILYYIYFKGGKQTVSERRPQKTSKDHHSALSMNHFFKAMNDFFELRPGKGLIESIDELFSTSSFGGSFPVELNENEKEYIVKAKLPGVKKEQIEIDVLKQHVTINVCHRETYLKENKNNQAIQKQETFKQLTRTIPLMKPIHQHNVSALYENGLLIVTIPKLRGKKVEID